MRSRFIARATMFILLFGGLLVWFAPKAEGWPSICDNCVEKSLPGGGNDARCCLDGACDNYLQNGYYTTKNYMEWCSTTVTYDSNGNPIAHCNGTANSCTAGGGGWGGGGGSCNVQWGDVCPAECFSCTRYY